MNWPNEMGVIRAEVSVTTKFPNFLDFNSCIDAGGKSIIKTHVQNICS